MNKYRELEKRLIEKWEERGVYRTVEKPKKKKKRYVLGMFPYPSGAGLHAGHVRIYTAVDVMARYFRMRGDHVLCPIGWDSFGLPAENAAIKAKVNPKVLVPKNEANFKRQCKMIGLSYDWDREFSTSDPRYYKWTQWIFLKLYSIKNKAGQRLIYRKEVPINWCPSCKTGLADEEVLNDGTHERCGKAVTKKSVKQWLFRITDYADRLLEDLEGLDWPSGIIEMQKNWIGRSEGVMIKFKLADEPSSSTKAEEIEVFTTRPDTLFGVTAMVLAPEHQLIKVLAGSNPVIKTRRAEDIRRYVENSKGKTELERTDLAREKTGVFTGLYCINPANGKKVPIWVADYVIGTYGGGAVMMVPAHDQRDYEFANKYNLEIREVISGGDISEGAYTGEGELVNSGEFTGLASEKAKQEITKWLQKRKLGRKSVNYKLRDWIFSRQRYWGEPMPLVYCSGCAGDHRSNGSVKETRRVRGDFDIVEEKGVKYAVVPVPADQLPVELPDIKSYEPTDTGESPLAKITDWVNTKCPSCGGKAKRETDTMPNWAASCWYFLRFSDPHNDKEAFNKDLVESWLPVDWYLGGAEHAVLHLLYARFWVKALFDLGLINISEPFERLRSVGLVLAEDGKKMSKSLGNIVNPDDVVESYGADTLRVYEMFMGPWNHPISWSTSSVLGAKRFVDKIWRIYDNAGAGGRVGREGSSNSDHDSSDELRRNLHRTIKKVGEDIEGQKFNTAISAMMEFVNAWMDSESGLSKGDMRKFLLLLAPFIPFTAEELWGRLGGKFSIHNHPWPDYDESLIEKDIVTVVVQVDGRVRGRLEVVRGVEESVVKEKAISLEKVKKYLDGRKIKSVVYIPGRIINFVIR